jgi:hypothetical protein
MTNQNFDQGASAAEREAFPEGPKFDQMGVRREYVGLGQLARDTRRQPVMGDELVRMAGNLSSPQMQHGLIWEQRGGTSQKQNFPDGTGHGGLRSPSPSGKIKATIRYDNGLGPAYARPGPSGHDPAATDQPTDYLHNSEGLERYVGAKDILQPSEYGSGFPVTHRLSQFPVMGDDIIGGFAGRTSRVASSTVPPPSQDKGAHIRSNRELGQS